MALLKRTLLAVAILLAAPLWAQDTTEPEDTQTPGFLENIIQNALGGDGRTVRIEGLNGALSSNVTIDRIEVSDTEGPWLSIADVDMSWRRLALLRRQVDIDSLSIGSVTLVRTPVAQATTPSIEASPPQPFSLPELPVSLKLGALSVGQVDLGETILGQATSLKVDGTAALADGEGNVALTLNRVDGPEGVIDLKAGFENATRRLFVNLDVDEAANGLIASLAKLPGQPAMTLTINGDAPLSDFAADIRLTTDETERLAGTVTVAQTAADTGAITEIGADIGGDLSPLFAPAYRDFLGDDIALVTKVRLDPAVGTQIETLDLKAQSLTLTGHAALAPNGMPENIALSGAIRDPEGDPVTLPLPGPITTVQGVTLSVNFDQTQGDQFLAQFDITGLTQDDVSMQRATLTLDGTLTAKPGTTSLDQLAAALTAEIAGLATGTDELNRVLDAPIQLSAHMGYDPNAGTVRLRDLDLHSSDLRLNGSAQVAGLNSELDIQAQADLATGDLARFAELAKRDLHGSFTGGVGLTWSPAKAVQGLVVNGLAQDLGIGDAKIDPFLEGRTELAISARRDSTGIELQTLQLENPQVSARGTGTLTSQRGALDLTASLNEAGLIAPHLSGPISLSAQASGLLSNLSLGLELDGAAVTDKIGSPVRLTADATYSQAQGHLGVPSFSIRAGTLRATGDADVTGLNEALAATADLTVATGNLDRIAALIGQPLAGSLTADVVGGYDTATGYFDADVQGHADSLSIGNPQIDAFLAGRSQLALTAHRDADGIVLENLDLQNPQVSATGKGALTGEIAALDLTAQVSEAGLLAPHLSGPLTLDAKANGPLSQVGVDLALGGTAITDQIGDPVDLTATVLYDPGTNHVGLPTFRLSAGTLSASGALDATKLATAPTVAADVKLDTGDLSRLARLLNQPLSGSLVADVVGDYASDTGYFTADVTGQAQDLAIGNPTVDGLLAGASDLVLKARRDETGIVLDRLDLENPQVSATGTGAYQADTETAALNLTARITEANLLAPQFSGPMSLTAKASGTAPTYRVALTLGDQAITRQLGEPAVITSDIDYQKADDLLRLPSLVVTAGDLALRGSGQIAGLSRSIDAQGVVTLDTGDLARFAPLVNLPLAGQLTADIQGQYAASTGAYAAKVIGQGTDIAIGSAQVDQLLKGTTDIAVDLQGQGAAITVDQLDITSPELTVSGQGALGQVGDTLSLSGKLANLGIFVPQLRGEFTLDAKATSQSVTTWDIDLNAAGPQGLAASVTGTASPQAQDLTVSAALGNLGVFVRELPGRLSAQGKVNGVNGTYTVDLAATGPANAKLTAKGRAYGPDGTMALDLNGTVPLAIANGFITPRTLTGNGTIDLRIDGAPSLAAISGTIRTSKGRFTDPNSGQVVEDITVTLNMAQSRATVDATAKLATGGTMRLSGPVALTAPYRGDLSLVLDSLTVVDPELFTAELGGQIQMTGNLAGGATIKGAVDIDRAEVRIPDAFGSAGDIPDITHVNEPRDSRATRNRAKLIVTEKSSGSGTTVAYPLDLQIRAPARIFVRGRGLDAEFGGQINVQGTTAAPSPTGGFSLIRGRMNLLNRLLVFSDATISLGGDLRPDLDMTAVSQNAPINATIKIQGPADSPTLTFSSSPALPEDEVLSQLFFGKPVRELTALEVAGLAAAINTLSGGGGGLMSKIRNELGVDQIAVGSDSDGTAQVSAGKYLSEDVYTDVTVNAQGESKIQLNYTLTPSVSVFGGFGSTGETSVGIGFEKDY